MPIPSSGPYLPPKTDGAQAAAAAPGIIATLMTGLGFSFAVNAKLRSEKVDADDIDSVLDNWRSTHPNTLVVSVAFANPNYRIFYYACDSEAAK